jgi:hypothetical protein
LIATSSLVAVLTVSVGLVLALNQDGRRRGTSRSIAPGCVPFGMLGDSDTAAYHDTVTFPATGPQPGGEFHAITFQWPEVLVRIRDRQVDLGEWAVWGVPRWLSMARVRDGLGLRWRGPQRQTHRHNLAWPSFCESLTEGAWRQAQRLVDVMDEQPGRWSEGVVVIRSGVNSFGKAKKMDVLAKNAEDPGAVALIASCVSKVREAVRLIHQSHPATRVVLVGILNNSDWPPYFDRWQSVAEQRNLNRGLDHFDAALRAMADGDPRLAFFDDRAWFAKRWGRRSADTGMPDYRAVRIGQHLSVTNTVGDSPEHAVLDNLHAGLVWNALWVQDLVELVRTQFGLPVDAISDAEVSLFVEARVEELARLKTRGR